MLRRSFVNHSADSRGFVRWIATDIFSSLLHQAFGELRRDLLLDQKPFYRGATLARVAETAFRRERHRQVEFGVIQNDEWIVAAKFEQKFLVTRDSGDAFADGFASSKRQHLYVGMAHERWGEVPRAFVTLRPSKVADAAELSAFVAERLAKFKVPKRIDVVDELPKGGSGKILKNELRRMPAT